jgi:hypothetical protein
MGCAFSEEVWAHADRGCETLFQAGFSDVQVTTLQLSGEYRDPEEAIETALAWPLTRYRIAQLDPTNQQRLKEETAKAIFEVDDLSWYSEIHYYQGCRGATASRAGNRGLELEVWDLEYPASTAS